MNIAIEVIHEDTINTDYTDNYNCAMCKAYRRIFNDNKVKLNNGVVDMDIDDKKYKCDPFFTYEDFIALNNKRIDSFKCNLIKL